MRGKAQKRKEPKPTETYRFNALGELSARPRYLTREEMRELRRQLADLDDENRRLARENWES